MTSKVKPSWSSHLVVKLEKGLARTIKRHRYAVRWLGIPKRGHTSVVENTPSARGVINQIKCLLSVETLEMYLERVQNEIRHKAPRPPMVIKHKTNAAAAAAAEAPK